MLFQASLFVSKVWDFQKYYPYRQSFIALSAISLPQMVTNYLHTFSYRTWDTLYVNFFSIWTDYFIVCLEQLILKKIPHLPILIKQSNFIKFLLLTSRVSICCFLSRINIFYKTIKIIQSLLEKMFIKICFIISYGIFNFFLKVLS